MARRRTTQRPAEPAMTTRVQRIDRGDGSVSYVDWDRAAEVISADYKPVDGVLKRLAMGHPIRCTFATYRLAKFAEEA